MYDKASLPDPAEQMYAYSYSYAMPAYTPSLQMYYVPLGADNVPGEAVLVHEDVAYFYAYPEDNGKMFYLANRKGDKCDLYMLSGEESERAGYDVSYQAYSGLVEGGEVLYFFENYNTGREEGDFYLFAGGEKTLVAEDVYDFYYRGRDRIYLLCNFNGGKGDLYLWQNGALKLIDYDVTGVYDFYVY
jgi:hypothetical protein